MDADRTIQRLFKTLHPRQPWMRSGLCADGYDTNTFFPHKDGDASEAKAICARCPSEMRCLEYALRYKEDHGVWGGLTERERRTLRVRIRLNDPEWLKVS